MFGIGANELIIILLFGFIIFGPDKLPGMAKTVGQFIARFRNAQAEMNRVIKTEVYDPDAEDPFKNPLDALSKIEQQTTREDRGESFTERKARYDKQRAAKKAAEERKAELEVKKAAEKAAKEAALEAGKDSQEAAEVAKAAGAAAAAKLAEEKAAKVDEEASATKKPTIDELYGTKPQAKKPAAKKTAAEESAAADEAEKAQDDAVKKAAANPVEKTVEDASDVPEESTAGGEGAHGASTVVAEAAGEAVDGATSEGKGE